MITRRGLLVVGAGAIAFAQSDDEVRRILSDRIGRDRQSLGMVAGLIDERGRRTVAQGDVQPDSLFEIGSITKVFTALLLADMVERGEVALRDPVAKYLPEGVKVPQRGPRPITLEDLATHMSGLPRVPTNLSPKSLANPYVDYTADRLYEFLRDYSLPREPGTKWEYSNLGAGLLGHVLSLRAGIDFETLVRLRICGPLDMTSTWITVPPEMKTRAATGHNALRQPATNWDFQVLAGAGAFWSSAGDLLEFVAASMGEKKSGLAPAMAAMLKVRVPTGIPNFGQALGWQTMKRGDTELIWKDGGTFGFSSFIGFDPKLRRGAVVLSDTGTGVVDIGMHLLDSRSALREFPAAKTEAGV
jgi:D-alanyl-D-alanine-carboxypeptidase/D-alanyl-D-alanine-endopeptidase